MKTTVEMCLQTLLVWSLLLCLNSCHTPPADERSEVEDVLRHKNWWNFYERGKIHLNNSNLVLAAEDFQRCLGLMPGARYTNDEPAWRVRTYGMHFEENYFPYRELGITYYLMGKNTDAVKALQESITHLPSARASFYLNKAQGKTFQGRRISPLNIDFDLPDEYLTSAHSLALTGQIYGEGLIKNLSVAGRTHFVEIAQEKVSFSESIQLNAGRNSFEVKCRDLTGVERCSTINLVADWEVPGIYIKSVKASRGQYHVTGYCEDNIGLSSVSFNGQSYFTESLPSKVTSYAFDWSFDSQHGAGVELKDLAGNAWEVSLRSEVQSFLSRNEQFDLQVALHRDQNVVKEKDRIAPSIRWRDGVFSLKTFQPVTFIDASVQDAGGIQRLELNGESLLRVDQKDLRSIRIGKFIRAHEGTNSFTMRVWDRAGNSAESSFTLVKEIPEYLWNRHRLRAAVLPVITAARDWSGDDFRLLMEYHLQNKPEPYKPRFFLLPVERTLWEKLLLQQELSLSGLADPRAVLRLPQYDQPDVLLKTHYFSDVGGFTVRCSAILPTTGRVIFSDDVYSESSEGKAERMIEALVSKIETRFPYAQGTLKNLQKGELEIVLDTPSKIEYGHQFLVINAKGKTLEDGFLRRVDDKRIDVRVIGRKGRVCQGEPSSKEALILLSEGDRLYTR